jgi:hypothetical protein
MNRSAPMYVLKGEEKNVGAALVRGKRNWISVPLIIYTQYAFVKQPGAVYNAGCGFDNVILRNKQQKD